MKIRFTLNDRSITADVEPNIRLLDLLRVEFNLTGTKEGCSIGECGACTVIMNGKAVNSCLVLAGQCDGAEIITIEGIEKEGKLHSLQENFLKSGAIQCGFCTPGMIMSTYALLLENPNPTEEAIKDAIAGNLCRCTGYKQIIDAVEKSAKEVEK